MTLSDYAAQGLTSIVSIAVALIGVWGYGRFNYRAQIAAANVTRDAANEVNLTQRFKLLIDGYDARTASLTKRFEALVDGYDARIKELTEEVTELRAEIVRLRHLLALRMQICTDCEQWKILMSKDGEFVDAPNPSS